MNFFPSSSRRPHVFSAHVFSAHLFSARASSAPARSRTPRHRSLRLPTTRLHATTSVAVVATMMALLALPDTQPPAARPQAAWPSPAVPTETIATSPETAPGSRSSYEPVEPAASDEVATAPRATGKWTIKVRDWRRSFARGGQDRIDRCQATLYWGPYPGKASGTSWLAGHNYCGFWRWDKWLPKGSTFKIKTPTGTVRVYRVYARGYVNRHGGSSAGLIEGDLTLITCRGEGTSFTYARLIDER